MSKYVEPRLRRDFSGVITAFVDFLKGNHTNLLSIFISYNFVFILIFFLYNYLVSDGIAGLIALSSGDIGGYVDYSQQNNEDYQTLGVIVMMLSYMLMIAFNAGLAGIYMRQYERYQHNNITGGEIFKLAFKKIGGVLLILVLAAIALLPTFIVAVISLIIPLLGIFVFLLIAFSFLTWIGLSIFAYTYHEDLSPVSSLGRGWQLLFSNYWKAVGVASLTAIIIQVLFGLFQLLPGAIIGIISYNSTLDNVELQEDIYIKAISFVFYAINSITTILSFLLIMFMYGYLYLNLHETKYNVYLQTRIRKLGEHL
ncbi:MAG: hypothetical protein NWQ09_03065 [Nonlabens sp.]|nr:hypothetical protein [Nonlabens sp.]